MSDVATEGAGISDIAMDRLREAEREGLRLAITCRTAIAAFGLFWYLGAGLFTAFEPRLAGIIALLAFTALGVAHLCVIGTRFDRWWMKYAVYAADMAGICALFVLVPVSRASDVPQIISFRAYGIYYLFPLVALATLSLSWRLVLWSGFIGFLGWWAAFLVVIDEIARPLSWDDIPSDATRADYETVFLSIDFVGFGNRIEESGLLFAGAAVLAFSVYRARRIFLKQIAAEREQRKEQAQREQVTRALGRYVPPALVDRLVAGEGRLEPALAQGSVLVMDIADFSRFAASRPPGDVIAELNAFLSAQADIVYDHDGVVISFTGDGLLAAFNTPVPVEFHEKRAVECACAMLKHRETTQFRIRIGIASGELAAGSVGSSSRQAFTIYGETVNRAARLEEHAKAIGQSLLCDAQTADAGSNDTNHRMHRVSATQLRGLSSPVEIYSVFPVSP